MEIGPDAYSARGRCNCDGKAEGVLRRASSAKNLIGAREVTIVLPELDFDPEERAIYYPRALLCVPKFGDEVDAT